jgi:hypothetical protein
MRTSPHYARLGVQASKRVLHDIWKRYRKLGWSGKALVWFIVIAHGLITGAIVTFGPKKIFQALLGSVPYYSSCVILIEKSLTQI